MESQKKSSKRPIGETNLDTLNFMIFQEESLDELLKESEEALSIEYPERDSKHDLCRNCR